jgi:hypothetical protein
LGHGSIGRVFVVGRILHPWTDLVRCG